MKAARRSLGDTSAPDYVDRLRFPADPWRLVETEFRSDDLGTSETLFAVGNGYLGLRGNIEEGHDAHAHGTFINGFHETWRIRHAEEAYGFARTGQTIVNVPDPKVIRLYVDDEPLLLSVADLPEYSRTLDMKTGVLTRDLLWRTPAGNRVRVRSRRMVSFAQRHLAIMTFEVTLLDKEAPVAVSSQLLNRESGADEYRTTEGTKAGFDPRKSDALNERVLEPKLHLAHDEHMLVGYKCRNSGMAIAVAMEHTVDFDGDVERDRLVEPDFAKEVFRFRAAPGRTFTLTKVVSYHTSRMVPARELGDRCHRTLERVRSEGVDKQFADQGAWLTDFWQRSDVEVDGDDRVQQAIRWNLFQLAQAAARGDGQGVAAKGVTGSGYSGHYFWDTEIYVVPFFVYTSPGIARNALRYRYRMLPKATDRAGELAQHGALFPWRTINGEEASAYYAAGTAQYHIDADISFAIDKYVTATGDDEFLAREGIDILVQTARMWADLGFWRSTKSEGSSFRIHGVTGPDEYTTVVNDNLYTNVMARFNLRCAAASVRKLARMWPEQHAKMVARLGLDDAEVAEWDAAAEAMAILWDEDLGIHPQDALFHERELWDLENTPPEKRPLLLHFHPLVIYRFQVLKQADVVLALFLQGDEFTAEEKKADFDYYDPITTGDSTLSGVVQSIMASEVGYHELALRYFWDGLFVDIADLHSNTADGVHVASAGGVWSALAHGFGGMRDYGGQLSFDPRLPASWPEMRFRVTQRGTRLLVTVKQESVGFTVEEGQGLTVEVRGERVSVLRGEEVVVPLADQGPRISGAPDAAAFHGTMRADGSVVTASLPAVVESEHDGDE
ncbi:glycoside hydrolase family 65 protein [Demequina lignilytica]|uniref:Glycosyl hydrolase family 65 protein n=1 Tax=Demequina lignilytica TaxID=3051663 RepID=A0AAW7M580_9MICO|nr:MULTISPECIES: glycosyl hydrolase family 65 protein [unclassified Demequina]MDN4477586.1 glycosyl hydrolase family 65 protein [Demequina sp. SYSU T00039-1]MDN4483631.1 glycosyl hydrolase family 65 protein [Demequina sp. SYSU T0a273]MDN4488063.1 glycosyl hydrolase family 65 protein [Demequina sp. SYSU T00039]MDN4490503.1 glycosyl hydrolase family 65 protein [Demequina sp. SYSU T00068]